MRPEFAGAVCNVAPAAADLRHCKEVGQRRYELVKSIIAKMYEDLGEKLEWNERERPARRNRGFTA
jgi:hypothetical protein